MARGRHPGDAGKRNNRVRGVDRDTATAVLKAHHKQGEVYFDTRKEYERARRALVIAIEKMLTLKHLPPIAREALIAQLRAAGWGLGNIGLELGAPWGAARGFSTAREATDWIDALIWSPEVMGFSDMKLRQPVPDKVLSRVLGVGDDAVRKRRRRRKTADRGG